MTAALDILPVTQMPADGPYGPAGTHGVTARLFDPPALATLAARRGGGIALAAAARVELGLDLADAPRLSRADGLSAIGTAPGRWLLLAGTEGDLAARLAPLAPHAAITEQTDAYVGVEIDGPHARDLLAKGVSLDLDPAAFPPGAAATTNVAHVNVSFWREPGEDRFVFLVARSYRVAFARFLVASGAEYGLELVHRG
ncbi:sarcosine oxidase subunit gamma [Ancylobacter oerskovii]|uniref:Sarcosine oxidase subunit gamma n=1 Tax=Ancylobacter oerskovii TaxID=459519 RepID=A0ABW4YXF6_9HYPH|nr:sarcosine oxidase subunit gamma family protein [Ancylobacter oerskovii]MBS7542214.1 sarcosine oxidase subunit gamma [Ancylobacter oerskovii]